jgi:thiol-disulfide isomerase/thioredoxin
MIVTGCLMETRGGLVRITTAMGDRVASFLFDNALVLAPAITVVCASAIVFIVRHWPKRIWTRMLAAAPVLLFIAIGAIACAALYAERNIRSIIQHRVGALTLHPVAGSTPQRVADLRGKVVLVNFWATWCPPCRAEMPDLNRLASEYKSNDVCILTITDEAPEQIALYQEKVIRLQTLVARFDSDQPQGKLAESAYQGRPTTVILDERGNVRDIFIGKQSYATLQQAIERQLRRRA